MTDFWCISKAWTAMKLSQLDHQYKIRAIVFEFILFLMYEVKATSLCAEELKERS